MLAMRRLRIVLVLAVLLCGLAIPSLQAGATKLDPLASFPIAAIGCTPTDVCLAVGTGMPTRVAWNQHGGPWITAMAPALRFDRSNVLSIGCSRFGCLLAGASGGHVATWIFDSGSHLIRASRWRLAGSGTSSVSCLPTGGCALLSLVSEATNSATSVAVVVAHCEGQSLRHSIVFGVPIPCPIHGILSGLGWTASH